MLNPSKLVKFRPTKVQRIGAVLAIASAFLVLELVLGFITRSLALVADAFHIMSDIIGYAVAMLATKYAASNRVAPAQYTFGYQRAETVGAFFNGAFLMALGVSALLQSIERFTDPTEITDPVLIMAVGAAGIGSNILMLAVLGGHAHGGHSHGGADHAHDPSDPHHSHEDGHAHAHELSDLDPTPVARTGTPLPDVAPVAVGSVSSTHHGESHDGHAHARLLGSKKSGRSLHDLNILGVLIHILGDALNSVAVIISGAVYKATGFVYADPIASLFVAFMIIGTAYPLLRRSLRQLLDAAPEGVDVQGVKEDIERVSGKGSVHDLRIWSLVGTGRQLKEADDKNVMASLHLTTPSETLNKDYDTVADNIRSVRLSSSRGT